MIRKHLPDIRQGDDYSLKLEYPDGMDITGFKWQLTLKSSFDLPDSSAVLQKVKIAGDSQLDTPMQGICYIILTGLETGNLPAGRYYYDLQAVSNTGVITTLLPPTAEYKYKIAVIPQITRGVL